MPILKDDKPAPDELTAEQKERSDAAYIAAVNKGLAVALKEADEGKLIPAQEVWDELGVESAGR